MRELRDQLRPYLLRRMKEDVEKLIPPKEEVIVEVAAQAPGARARRLLARFRGPSRSPHGPGDDESIAPPRGRWSCRSCSAPRTAPSSSAISTGSIEVRCAVGSAVP